ncbi:MAG: HEAT repeat domain-containing protein [Planctomycetota bacterium]|nr:HEAT repeat domain-containing protein [Planctomycetota bacterium]
MAKYVTLSLALAGAVLVGFWVAGCSDPEKDLNNADPNKRAGGVRKLAEREDDAVVEKLAKAVEDPNVMVAVTAVESGLWRIFPFWFGWLRRSKTPWFRRGPSGRLRRCWV